MSYTLIDRPVFYSKSHYNDLINKLTFKLSLREEVLSVYQIGSVASPGISDIDLVCVFKDNTVFKEDLRADLSSDERYLLCHNLFGMHESSYIESKKFSFFSNPILLFGKSYPDSNPSDLDEISVLKRQIAIEYLVRIYTSLSVQMQYGIFKVRSILLEIKALRFDFEYLNVYGQPINDLLESIISIREDWFESENSEVVFYKALIEFYKELTKFLTHLFLNEFLFVNATSTFLLSRNLTIKNASKFAFYHRGVVLPSVLARPFGRKFFNLQHRFNRFTLTVPMVSNQASPILLAKQKYEMRNKVEQLKIPFFMPLTSSLNV